MGTATPRVLLRPFDILHRWLSVLLVRHQVGNPQEQLVQGPGIKFYSSIVMPKAL